MSWRRASAVLCVVLAACGSQGPRTSGELRDAIDAYERAEPDASQDRIKALFAKLDAEIAARRETLAAERRELQSAYLRARVARLGTATEDALETMGEELGKGLEDAGRALRESMREGAPE
jgi:Skp family chaperone for outer membrane proteins